MIEDSYHLSPMQHGVLFHTLLAPRSGMYVQQFVGTLCEDLDVSAFLAALERVVERHTILRTSILWERVQAPSQQVHSQVDTPITEEDWRQLSSSDQQPRLEAFLEADLAKGIDFSQAPLMRFALLRMADTDYRFIWTSHHALLDGRSRLILLHEIFTLYEAVRLWPRD